MQRIETPQSRQVIKDTKPKPQGAERYWGALPRFVVNKLTQRVLDVTSYSFPPDFEYTISSAIQDNFAIDLDGNHTAWADALLLAPAVKRTAVIASIGRPLGEEVRGAFMPFAKSLKRVNGENGSRSTDPTTPERKGQGKLLSIMFDATLPILVENGVIPVYTATPNDVQKRDEQRNQEEFLAHASGMIKAGFEMRSVLPEGTVQGGRRDDNGNRIGMQLLAENATASAYAISRKFRRKGVLFIPVGIVGGYEINDPSNHKLPTLEGWKAGLLGKTGVCSVTVGEGIRTDDADIQYIVKHREFEELDTRLGLAMAQLLPVELRGVYATRETADLALQQRRDQKLAITK